MRIGARAETEERIKWAKVFAVRLLQRREHSLVGNASAGKPKNHRAAECQNRVVCKATDKTPQVG